MEEYMPDYSKLPQQLADLEQARINDILASGPDPTGPQCEWGGYSSTPGGADGWGQAGSGWGQAGGSWSGEGVTAAAAEVLRPRPYALPAPPV
jgi:hypothetical protein